MGEWLDEDEYARLGLQRTAISELARKLVRLRRRAHRSARVRMGARRVGEPIETLWRAKFRHPQT